MLNQRVQRMRDLGNAMIQRGQSADPVDHWTQALARVAQGFTGRMQVDKANQLEDQRMKQLADAFSGNISADKLLQNPETMDYGLKLKLSEASRRPITAPSDWQTAMLYMKGTPEQRAAFDKTKRQQQFLNLQDRYINPATNQQLMMGVKPAETPEHKGAVAAAQDMAKAGVKKEIARPKVENMLAGKSGKTSMLGGMIDRARNQASGWTTGFVGNIGSQVPGTDAYDLSRTLDTIKSNIGFDRLQEMRDNSPTGGALGQVSEMENRLLQTVWGNLEQSQSEEQFLRNLDIVEKQVEESWERVRKAYEQDYGRQYEEGKPDDDPLTLRR